MTTGPANSSHHAYFQPYVAFNNRTEMFAMVYDNTSNDASIMPTATSRSAAGSFTPVP